MKRSVLLFFCLCISIGLMAQKKLITGSVVDEKNEPIVGAYIQNLALKAGTITDVDGKFSFNAEVGSEIQVSFIGYTTQRFKVSEKSVYAIVLTENTTALNEVVITGYGGKQNQATVTSSISKIDNKALANRVIANPASALVGAASGVVVQQTSGMPGAMPSITIRGGTNFDGSGSPLVVVDGLIRDMNDINPEDIASIDILKDAAATSIYGARASNGVVLISTKKGKQGSTSITVDAKVGVNTLSLVKSQEFLDARGYLQWMRPAVKYAIDRFGVANRLSAVGCPYSNANLYYDAKGNVVDPRLNNQALYSSQKITNANRSLLKKNGWEWMVDPINPNDTLAFTNTNFKNQALNNPSISQDYNISMQGGSDKGNYYAGLGYYTENGLPVTTYYKRLTFTFNGDYKIKSWLTSTSNVNFSEAKWRGIPNTSEASYFGRMLGQPPTQREKNEAGQWVERNAGDGNPLINESNYIIRNIRDKFTYGQSFQFDIFKGFYVKVGGTWFFDESPIETFNKDLYVGPSAPNASGIATGTFNLARASAASYDRTLTQNYLATANYSKVFAQRHSLDLLVGTEYYDIYNKGFKASGTGAPTDAFMDLALTSSAANMRSIDSWHTRERIFSVLGRANYNFDQKYLASFTFREDGYSKLLNNRWGFFPGATAGWLIHKENFFAPLKSIISFAKIRASYGQNGNVAVSSITPYSLQGEYGNTTNYNNVVSYYLTMLAAPNLMWEKTITYEGATDLGFFDNSLKVTFDYFYRLTQNKITNIALPQSSGVSSALSNNGSLSNKGMEIEINYTLTKSKDLVWKIGANGTYSKNKVVTLPNNGLANNRQGGTQVFDPKSGKRIWVAGLQEGQEPNQIATWVYQGVWKNQDEINANAANLYIAPSSGYSATTRPMIGPNRTAGANGVPANASRIQPGDARYMDIDRNDTIDYRDRKVIGSTIPKFTGGINTSLDYKGFSLYVSCDFALGFYNYNTTDAWLLGMMQGEWNINNKANETWTPENPNAKYPRLSLSDQSGAGNFARQSTLFWTRGDYLAFRVVTLGYNLPKKWCEKLQLQNLKVSVTGQNLGYLTKNQMFSPESRNASELSGGAGYPLPRTFIFAIKATL